MQLFILDRDPEQAARMLCDAHLRKMCLETAQILSARLFLAGRPAAPAMPKPCYVSHPVIRALDTAWKLNWAVACNEALHREYLYRFGKPHAYCGLAPEYRRLQHVSRPDGTAEDWTFARAFHGLRITEPDLVAAYRQYYRFKKNRLKHWRYTHRAEPGWLTVPDAP